MVPTKTASRKKGLSAAPILAAALLLTAACSLSGPNTGGEETLSALSTQNAELVTEVTAQQTALAELSAENPPQAQEPAGPPPTYDPTSAMQITSVWSSPDESVTALILEDHLLALEDSTGNRRILYESEKISGLSWFPDNSWIALSDHIQDDSHPLKVRDRLLLIDTTSGETSILADGFAPAVSPDGQWIAFYAGIQYGDACSVGWQLGFLRIDPTGTVQQTALQADFSGLPGANTSESFYPSTAEAPSSPGVWTGPQQFESYFSWACVDQPEEDGVYLFDLDTMTASKGAGS